METNIQPLSLGTSDALPAKVTMEKFTAIVAAERETGLSNLRAEYTDRANALKARSEQVLAEYRVVGQIRTMNDHPDQLTPDICLQFERELANLGHEQLFNSTTLAYFTKRYGDKLVMGMVGETIQYYTKALKSTNRMSDVEIMQLAAELIIRHKELKYLELVYVLHNGTRGKYGKNFNRIDQEVIWGWFNQYFVESAAWLETKRVNERVEGSNVKLVDPIQQELERFTKLAKQKQAIYENVKNKGKEK